MASMVPQGFLDIRTAIDQKNQEVNIIGVVTDLMPATRSRGSDWMCTFSIADDTYGFNDDGLKVRYFRPLETELPNIEGTGDVIALRNIKIKEWSGMSIALAKWSTTYVIFPASSISEKSPSNLSNLKHVKDHRSAVPSASEMHYAIHLCNSRKRSSYTTPKSLPPPSSIVPLSQGAPPMNRGQREKFSLIKDVQIDNFYDLVGQVVKIYPNNGCVELYITDYTSNQLLYNYEWGRTGGEEEVGRDGDEFGYIPRNSSNKKWPGPFGRSTLTVTLWPSHSYFAQANVKEQDFVFLRNVRIRYSKDAKVEGSMHTDQRDAARVDVSILKTHQDDDRVKNVLRRKQEYLRKFKDQSQNFVNEVRGEKRKTGDKEESKSGAKKRRKKEREELALAQRNEESKQQDKIHKIPASPLPKPSKQELNKNSISLSSSFHRIFSLDSDRKSILKSPVHCSHLSVPPRPLSSILSLATHALKTPNGTPYTLPFQNINSRTTVRIIDFFPPDLADFAVRCPRPSEFDVLSENENSGSSDDQSEGPDAEERRWEWRFGLVLEDAMGSRNEEKATMTAYVAAMDGDFLLRLDAEE